MNGSVEPARYRQWLPVRGIMLLVVCRPSILAMARTVSPARYLRQS